MPTFRECQRCAACCRWPGWVRVSAEEIARIAAFLGLSEREFIARHTRLHPDRRGLALLEQANGECEFLDGRDCRIQSVKPQQCRDFPNVWNHPDGEPRCWPNRARCRLRNGSSLCARPSGGKLWHRRHRPPVVSQNSGLNRICIDTTVRPAFFRVMNLSPCWLVTPPGSHCLPSCWCPGLARVAERKPRSLRPNPGLRW